MNDDLRTALLTLERNLRSDARNHGTDIRNPRLVLENRANDVTRILEHYPLEEQVKPAIEEPTEFGSLIRASILTEPRHRPLWQISQLRGMHYWESETGAVEVWSELTDVEVLRVGLGETSADSASDVETAGVYANGIVQGRAVMSQWVLVKLRALLSEAITSERKNAYEKAIQAVEELAP